MFNMPIKEKMATMQQQKQLCIQQNELRKVQCQLATIIEPLQETALETRMTLIDTHVEIQKKLEEVKEKIVEHITTQTTAEVLD